MGVHGFFFFGRDDIFALAFTNFSCSVAREGVTDNTIYGGERENAGGLGSRGKQRAAT
jgi:hypothetical protein